MLHRPDTEEESIEINHSQRDEIRKEIDAELAAADGGISEVMHKMIAPRSQEDKHLEDVLFSSDEEEKDSVREQRLVYRRHLAASPQPAAAEVLTAGDPTSPARTANRTIVITIEDFSFSESLVVADVGDILVFKLAASVPAHAEHIVYSTSEASELKFESPLMDITGNTSYSFCLRRVGELLVSCKVYRDMLCVIRVGTGGDNDTDDGIDSCERMDVDTSSFDSDSAEEQGQEKEKDREEKVHSVLVDGGQFTIRPTDLTISLGDIVLFEQTSDDVSPGISCEGVFEHAPLPYRHRFTSAGCFHVIHDICSRISCQIIVQDGETQAASEVPAPRFSPSGRAISKPVFYIPSKQELEEQEDVGDDNDDSSEEVREVHEVRTAIHRTSLSSSPASKPVALCGSFWQAQQHGQGLGQQDQGRKSSLMTSLPPISPPRMTPQEAAADIAVDLDSDEGEADGGNNGQEHEVSAASRAAKKKRKQKKKQKQSHQGNLEEQEPLLTHAHTHEDRLEQLFNPDFWNNMFFAGDGQCALVKSASCTLGRPMDRKHKADGLKVEVENLEKAEEINVERVLQELEASTDAVASKKKKKPSNKKAKSKPTNGEVEHALSAGNEERMVEVETAAVVTVDESDSEDTFDASPPPIPEVEIAAVVAVVAAEEAVQEPLVDPGDPGALDEATLKLLRELELNDLIDIGRLDAHVQKEPEFVEVRANRKNQDKKAKLPPPGTGATSEGKQSKIRSATSVGKVEQKGKKAASAVVQEKGPSPPLAGTQEAIAAAALLSLSSSNTNPIPTEESEAKDETQAVGAATVAEVPHAEPASVPTPVAVSTAPIPAVLPDSPAQRIKAALGLHIAMQDRSQEGVVGEVGEPVGVCSDETPPAAAVAVDISAEYEEQDAVQDLMNSRYHRVIQLLRDGASGMFFPAVRKSAVPPPDRTVLQTYCLVGDKCRCIDGRRRGNLKSILLSVTKLSPRSAAKASSPHRSRGARVMATAADPARSISM